MRKTAKPLWLLSSLILLLLPGLPLSAQTGDQAGRAREDPLTLRIAVMGPGDELYFWWGHIGLIIENADTGRSDFYDYGIFSFRNAHFFTNFAFGRLLYSCGVSPTNSNIAQYISINRAVTLYTLDLPPEKKEEVRQFVEQNVLPENRDYYYHHFKDNCATRIRDIIDLATGGQFFEALGNLPGRYTLRQHVRRHTWFSPFFDWFLNFCMGQDIDTPITVWQEMFLPAEIGRRIEDFRYRDPSGRERNLVSSVEVIHRAPDRPAVLEVPRKQWPRELLLGSLLAAALGFFLILRRKKNAAGNILLGLSQSILGLFFGGAGSILFFMTFFTNHDYTYHNSNILYINPLLLAAVPLGILFAAAKDEEGRFIPDIILRALWTYVSLGLLVSMAIKILPGFYQQNQVTQAMVLPIALVLSFAPGLIEEFLRRVFWRWFD
ncbi:MAG: DUF4105 domain-containing protein [Treponema sp.]|nr:DUF4105 domain-containing protein [Treponema sp.]